MTVQEARAAFHQYLDTLSAYQHACSLISYDGSTTAPKGTASNRAHTQGILSEVMYKLGTEPMLLEAMELLDANREALTEAERREVYLELKHIREMQKIPMAEYVSFESFLVEADDVWHTAKETNDFPLFEPYLQRIFDTTRKFAGYVAPEKDPYDYCLDKFEEGLNRETCDRFFAEVRSRLVPLLRKIAEKPQVDDSLLHGSFPEAEQDKLSRLLMETMGIDLLHCGLGTTEHPFTTSFGSHRDVRITTHYFEDNFVSSMYSVIHEGGHAQYMLGVSDDYLYTNLDDGASMGLHESQSRFYENLIGRSRPFCELIFPKLQELFSSLRSHTAEEFYRAVNKAEPSLIRTEADEFTYCLHIMVRYEIEQKVIAGTLAVHDIPAEWNRLYREYLGIEVPDDRQGCLQDSHWSFGGIGYFPTYALGSAYGAQFLARMKESVDVDGCIACGDFAPVNKWNREHIWQFGGLYPADKLLERVLGGPFDADAYLSYLEQKAVDIYGIAL